MADRDCLHRFVFEQLPFRGHIVHVDAAWRALIEHREYPLAVRNTLGEAVAASILLAATLKFEGMLTLQLQGNGPMHLMLAQCSSGLGVRALARYKGEPQSSDIAALAGEGRMTVTLDAAEVSQRYQGIVPLQGERLQQCLEMYFEQSEQLPTRLWLHADENGASGMLLQRLPEESRADRSVTGLPESTGEHSVAAIDDAWNRIQLMGETLKGSELRTLSDREILQRLFAEDDVRLFEPAPVFFRCTCSHERVSGMLRSLGEAEIRSVLKEQGQVEVRCDFCNRAYLFDTVDVERLFALGDSASASGSVH
jgi:molecular chaperone Hsp33